MKLSERGRRRREKGGKRAGKRQRDQRKKRRDRKVGRRGGRKRGGNKEGRERRKGFCRGLFQQPPATAAQNVQQKDDFSAVLLPSIPISKQPLRNTEFKRQGCTERSDFLPRIQCLQEAQTRQAKPWSQPPRVGKC